VKRAPRPGLPSARDTQLARQASRATRHDLASSGKSFAQGSFDRRVPFPPRNPGGHQGCLRRAEAFEELCILTLTHGQARGRNAQ
jgi:hypothetical protein